MGALVQRRFFSFSSSLLCSSTISHAAKKKREKEIRHFLILLYAESWVAHCPVLLYFRPCRIPPFCSPLGTAAVSPLPSPGPFVCISERRKGEGGEKEANWSTSSPFLSPSFLMRRPPPPPFIYVRGPLPPPPPFPPPPLLTAAINFAHFSGGERRTKLPPPLLLRLTREGGRVP